MGLDLVELIMRFEEEFETEIPDLIASTLQTPRDVIDYLLSKPEIQNKGTTREAIVEKVWLIIEDEIGINPNEFNEDSFFMKICILIENIYKYERKTI